MANRFMVTLDGNRAVELYDGTFAYSNSLTKARADMRAYVRQWRDGRRMTAVRHGNGKVASSFTIKKDGGVVGELRIVRFEDEQKHVLLGDGYYWAEGWKGWTKDLCQAKTFDTREEAVAYRSANRMFECEVRLIDARTVVG
jgi:hypothetical protein